MISGSYGVAVYSDEFARVIRLMLPTYIGPISVAILWGMGRGILAAGLVVGA